MMKNMLLSMALLLSALVSFGQLYHQPVYPQGYFRWPTNLTPDIVANMGELRPNHWHMGLDVRTNQVVNQNVYAAADGYISFVGIEPLSWGRWIIINHPNGLSTLYGHLNNFRDDLEKYVTEHQYSNQSWETHLTIPPNVFPVKKGDFISFSGTTGGSAGPHVHWEIMETKSGRRLNPLLFGVPITDNVPPTVVRIAMYDRSNSVFDQSPSVFKLLKSNGAYTVQGGNINTNFNKLSFSIQAYDGRNNTSNQDGIFSARLFLDNREISSFYIDSISYDATRYINAQLDYKMMRNGSFWMQHTSKLPGDLGGVYHDLGPNSIIKLNDTLTHIVRIDVADAMGNTSSVNFNIKNNAAAPPFARMYEWEPLRPNKLLKPAFEAYLPVTALYDKMNTSYSSRPSSATNSVSATHTLGETYIPVQSNFEVRIKPDKAITENDRNCVVIKQSGKSSATRKALWNGEWLTAQFRDFGNFEAFIDRVPPSINSLGSGDVVNLNKATRISFTPTDNYGIAYFRAEVDGRWLRFTNDKGRTWIYNFDGQIAPGQHTLTVTVTDIAGNVTKKSWQFVRGVNPPAPEKPTASTLDEQTAKPVVKKETAIKKTAAASSKAKTTAGKKTTEKKSSATKKTTTKSASTNKKSTATKKATTPKKTVDKKKTDTKTTTTKKTTTKKKK